jgi:hypothetical protein
MARAFLFAGSFARSCGWAELIVIARLAPDRPMQHALAGGVVGLIVSTAGAVVTWNKGPAFGPHWYPLALIVLAIPTAWMGGRLREVQLRERAG